MTAQPDLEEIQACQRLQEREDDRCSWPHCRTESEIIFRAGSTDLNPNADVGLCNEHHQAFSRVWWWTNGTETNDNSDTED